MWWKLLIAAIPILAIILAVARRYGANRWKTDTNRLWARLEASRTSPGPPYDPREPEGLPAPVQRYFRAVLKAGQPMIAAATVAHTGVFNLSASGERWRPFTSVQRVVTRPPGFVWDARIRMGPGLRVHVHDAYVAGEGLLKAGLLGLVPVMEQPKTPELAQGELMRFFAEAAWYPTALLPGRGVRWEAVDDERAAATLTDGATSVKLVFRFDAQGLLTSVRSDGRYRDVDGKPVATPWEGRFRDYAWRDGMRIPLEGEVRWLLPEGPQAYWRGRIRHVAYEYAP
jgi:hypothetical protein